MTAGSPFSVSKTDRREFWIGMVFIAPWVIGLLAFTLYPIIMSLYYSLTEYKVISAPEFIGFANYTNLFKDGVFLKALGNTLYVVIVGVPLTLLAAFSSAILLNAKELRRFMFFRIIFFLPTLVPLIINCILWLWLLNSENGLINALIGLFGLKGPPWLGSPIWAKPAFILMMIWGCGGTIIIFLAGMQDISESMYEAASIEGASFMQKTIKITIPMLSPVILFNAVTLVIAVFQWFAEPFIMTEGGPDNSTMFYSLYLYENAFRFFKMGYASAMAWVLLLMALAVIFLLFKGIKRLAQD